MTRIFNDTQQKIHSQMPNPKNSVEKRLKVILGQEYLDENGIIVPALNETYQFQLAEALIIEGHEPRFDAAHLVFDTANARRKFFNAFNKLSREERNDVLIPEIGSENELETLKMQTALISPTHQKSGSERNGAVKETGARLLA